MGFRYDVTMPEAIGVCAFQHDPGALMPDDHSGFAFYKPAVNPNCRCDVRPCFCSFSISGCRHSVHTGAVPHLTPKEAPRKVNIVDYRTRMGIR